MLDAAMKQQLAELLTRLQVPVELRLASDDSTVAAQLKELCDDVAGTSGQVSVVEDDRTDIRRPSFQITRPGEDVGIRFAGVPMGHEFTSLVLALLQVGGHPSKEDEADLKRAQALQGPLHFETFFSQSCQNCPDVVQALNLLAVLNPQVTHTAIEGSAFKDEAEARGVLSVPTVFLNGEDFLSGHQTFTQILDAIQPTSAVWEEREPYDVLVVGGGPAGATAAIYAARKGLRTGMIAGRVGGQVLDTASLENVPSIEHIGGNEFASNLEAHARKAGVEIISGRECVSLTRDEKDAPVGGSSTVSKVPAALRLEVAGGGELRARAVIIATGAKWRKLGITGEERLRNHGVTYCPHCDGPLFAGKPVAVIGGGNSGVEAAIDLAGVCSHVTLLEFLPELRADEVLQRSLAALDNVDVRVNAQTTSISGKDKVDGVTYTDRVTSNSYRVPVAGVFVQVGLEPMTEWLGDSLELSERGEIEVDPQSQATSMPGVFAAGDCTTSRYKQVVISAGDGAHAALSAFDYLIRTGV